MNVSVVDEREQQEQQRPYEVTITPMTPDDSSRAHGSYTNPITLPYNPEEYTIAVVPNWAPRQAAATGHHRQFSDYEHTEPRRLTTQQVLQPVGDPDACERIRTHLEAWAGRPTTLEARPTLVQIQFGTRLFIGNIDHFEYTARQTDAQGRIRTMEFSLTITENLNL